LRELTSPQTQKKEREGDTGRSWGGERKGKSKEGKTGDCFPSGGIRQAWRKAAARGDLGKGGEVPYRSRFYQKMYAAEHIWLRETRPAKSNVGGVQRISW